ncbi:hypothetical protein POM88_029759 [Heracleum sosnowskyi]|uniref:Uncharacterized protein n=1 Tax=Heracleum sosnowskyi TaxID=360622 RepID=A0AAD8HUR2_9APIA|nr:hypothetical protein POM88_029759 [Heracleum sosnowskyi]
MQSLVLHFYCEFGKELPEKLLVHVPCGRVWLARFVQGSYYIQGLKDMMSYYGLKPYHMVLLQYVGGANFNMRFFTPYGVEMKYPTDHDVPEFAVITTDMICTDIEEDKLCSTFNYNVYRNFAGLYNLVIESNHLSGQSFTKVLSEYACYQLRLNDSIKYIRLGFEEHDWKIGLKGVDDEVFFSKTWLILAVSTLPCTTFFLILVYKSLLKLV